MTRFKVTVMRATMTKGYSHNDKVQSHSDEGHNDKGHSHNDQGHNNIKVTVTMPRKKVSF